jgi:hypothetical protein
MDQVLMPLYSQKLEKNTDEVQISTAEKLEIFKNVAPKSLALTSRHTDNWAVPSKGFRNILNASIAPLTWKNNFSYINCSSCSNFELTITEH